MRVGVAEGCEEVPASECLPLEYNLDYMRGGMSSMQGVCSLGVGRCVQHARGVFVR